MRRRVPFASTWLLIGMAAIIALLLGVLFGPQLMAVLILKRISRGDPSYVPYAVAKLDSPSWHVRSAAAHALIVIGPPGEPAVPRLIQALNDESQHVATTAAVALGAIRSPRPEAVEALTLALQAKNSERRRYAAYALQLYGPQAISAVPQLIKALDDPHTATTAAVALKNIGIGTPEALPPLKAMLRSPEPYKQTAALEALSQYRALPEDIISMIATLQSSPHDIVRREAAKTLASVQPEREQPRSE